MVLAGLDINDPIRDDVREIKNAGERAASLTRQLLAFSRKQILQLKPLNLNTVVRDMDKLLQRMIGEDINLTSVLDPDLVSVKADRGQIEQVIMNLAVNARDAMENGGRLTVETSTVDLDQQHVLLYPEGRPGRYAMLKVSDDGPGMSKDMISKIFEPFFTTKQKGESSGLGLSTVYGIVKQSGGYISVDSEPDQGTTFKVFLPALEEGAGSVDAGPAPHRETHGTETVLVVEDEESVRNLLRRILSKSGYTVLAAATGSEAIEICEQYRAAIHLMLTDVVLPRMSGGDLVKRLNESGMDILVLYMSGYTDDAIVHHGVLDHGIPFIQKPFTSEKILGKIREVLDSASGRDR
jgi:CheY-like chemotaxis protein